MDPSNDRRSDPVAAGWKLLAEGEWSAAKSVFSGILGSERAAEALEGLSWAAWWLDDAEGVFHARERAYLLYRQQDARAAAARMATWLAADELDFRGAVAVASGWLRRARSLLESVEAGPDHGWLAFHEGFVALHSGDSTRAARLGAETAGFGRRFEVPDLEMLGLALEGSVLVSRADVEKGMAYLDEATATAMAGEATIPISAAWACCFLVGSCTAVFDFERAFEWCDRIAEFAERYGSRYMLAFCRAEYGQVYLWRGEWGAAEKMLEASISDFAASRPAMVAGPLISLAELRRRQDRPEEATKLLDQAGPTESAQLGRARLALDQGQPKRAADLVERLLRQVSAQRKLERVPALELLIRARVASGELPAVPAAADAVDRFLRIGAPFEAARARIDLAGTLTALGQSELAAREAVAARHVLLDLGAVAEAERARRVLEHMGDRRGPGGVTSRERDVLELIAEGLTNRQIAAQLVISEHTVHRHVTNILRKLDLPSRTAAAAYALRTGLLDE